ncbi:hypothetical protein SISSUDRAFT_653468 [Sistotremastrum suecicum HHB10207 ss-3]|uniref:F-box domain-containing protein n=1 Tax=Sistotremastrum suecicum HHB10207 ss-3 TaxID=1314776 RepID=A0A166E8U4_9AGAM|nr:hypothetical protein SISSUDRAFT_653468 [Sistotremastrum suecicum HHB10207 ss-3]
MLSDCGRRIELKYESDTPYMSYSDEEDYHLTSFRVLSSFPNHLSSLRIHCYNTLPLQDLIHALRSWPRLTRLLLNVLEADFASLLIALEELPLICPDLEILDCRQTKFCVAHMVRFLTFRISQGAPLRELRFAEDCPDGAVGDIRPLVQTLSEEPHWV